MRLIPCSEIRFLVLARARRPGQAGKDAGANFINHIGGKVSARSSVGDGSRYQVPVFKMLGSGGNNEWAVPINKDGEDIAEVLRQDPKLRSALREKLQKRLDSLKPNSNNSKIKSPKKRIAALEKPINYRDGSRNSGISTENAKDFFDSKLRESRGADGF